MVSFKLIVILLAATISVAIVQYLQGPPPPKRHKLEVGKTLAQVRMRRLGVEGNWRDYTTTGLRCAGY